MEKLRLIIDPPKDGPWNMAVDEALLESAADSRVASLRLYTWSVPTLSLGYFQPAADRQTHVSSLRCPLVRRASGGGAILHDRELTYSLVLPEKTGLASAARHLYDTCHATLISVLTSLGIPAKLYSQTSSCAADVDTDESEPFLCFQRRTCFDIVSGNAKIVGSAQRRRRGSILQHGSILLAQSAFAPELLGIEELTGKPQSDSELIAHWPPRLAGAICRALTPGGLTFDEHNRAEILCRERFAANDWLIRR